MKYLLFIGLLLIGPIANAVTDITYYHTDHLGSPILATDTAARVVWRSRYRPYGSRDQGLAYHLASTDNPIWYAGHEQDGATSLSYMQARFYSAHMGRFLSPDPRAFSPQETGSFNRYSYANNNPYRYRDPDGREAVLISLKGTAAPGAGLSAGGGIYVTFPARDKVPLDIGLFSNAALVAGADMSAMLSVTLLDGGRENFEGVQINAGATLPLTGVLGPAVDVEHVVNPVTGKSVGSSLGVGLAAFPSASASVGAGFVTFSLRDTFTAVGDVHQGEQAETDVQPAIEEIVWFSHIAM